MSIDNYTENPNLIKVVRGNYLQQVLTIKNPDGSLYASNVGDILQFAVRESSSGEYIIAPRTLSNNVLEIFKEDFDSLTFTDFKAPRKLMYEILLKVQGTVPQTVIRAPLWVYASVFEAPSS